MKALTSGCSDLIHVPSLWFNCCSVHKAERMLWFGWRRWFDAKLLIATSLCSASPWGRMCSTKTNPSYGTDELKLLTQLQRQMTVI